MCAVCSLLAACSSCQTLESSHQGKTRRPCQPQNVSHINYIYSNVLIRAASEDELSRFHSREYVAALRRYGSYRGQDDDTEDDGDDLDEVAVNEYGLGKFHNHT